MMAPERESPASPPAGSKSRSKDENARIVDTATLPFAASGRIGFAGFVLDPRERLLRSAGGEAVELRPQAYAVLELLARRAGSLVTKNELMDAVWPGVVVTDDSLVQAVGDLRHALGSQGRNAVRTVPRRGYMLVGAGPADGAPPAPMSPSRTGLRWAAGGLAATAIAAAAVAWYSRPAAPLPSRSVAVLPFHSQHPGPEARAIALDVASNLVAELARSPDLRVISSQSSFRLDPATTPLSAIGERLHARYLVDGTVEREGEHLRIRVDLVDSTSGQVMLTRRELADRASMGSVQQSLVGRIAGTLQSRVMAAEDRSAAAAPKNMDVVALTAQGKALNLRYSAADIVRARAFFEQALALDPDYAPAWVHLGLTNVVDTGLHLTGQWEMRRMPEALAQIQRGIARQPDMPVAYVALSQAQGTAGNFAASLHAAERCRVLSPNEPACFYALGSVQLRLGRVEAAVANLGEAMDRNPLAPAHFSAFYGTALWAAGRFDDALRVADECLAVSPDFWRCRQDRIASLVALGRRDEARAEAQRLHAMVPEMTVQWFAAGFSPQAGELATRRVAAARVAGME
jgi:DNA-binding winged helix-turn-helix (wHTH) protein/TolB-like protein